jgi:hypothetical protein
MLRSRRSALAVLLSTGALFGGFAGASAQAQPVITGGLVNVTITDVLSQDQITVQVPVGVAANVCGFDANVLAQQLNSDNTPSCTASNDQTTANLPIAFR